MGNSGNIATWLVLCINIMRALGESTTTRTATTIPTEKVMKQFIFIPAMRMAEYNFWWSTPDIDECALRCLEETRIYCKSFSYSFSAAGCGVYENSRAEAPLGIYGEPINSATETGISPSWNYYERKSPQYKELEKKMERLANLTEISVEEATELLSEFGSSLVTDVEPEGSGHDVPVAPGELDLMSQMLKLVVNLNPISEASVEVSEKFTNILVNVSGSMMQPAHTQSWIALQRNPEADGVAGIVASSEIAVRDVSERLLFYDNSTSFVAESTNIGMWMDVVEIPQSDADESDESAVMNFTNILSEAESQESANQFLGQSLKGMYIFPPRHNATNQNESKPLNPTDEDAILGGDVIMLPSKALRNRSVVTHVRYKGLKEVIPAREITQKSPSNGTALYVKSAVLTTSIYPRPQPSIFEDEPVILIFTHNSDLEDAHGGNSTTESPKDAENSSASPIETISVPSTIEKTIHCVFWQEGKDSESGGWSEEGCELESTNETHTICKCKHLTSFAVLLKMVDTSVLDEAHLVHLKALSFISYIGCALSLGGVVIMCGAFIMLKFHTENMKIHFNLGVAVGAADLVFIFEELAQKQQYTCVLVTVLLYYFNMAVLSWMLIEGLFLYSQVVVVFVSARRWVKYYVFAGWGIPAVVMGISMGILNVQLGSNKICWLSPADNSIWAFAAPAILVIVINFVILISVVRVIVGIQPGQMCNAKIGKVKNAVKGSIFLSPLLGTTWLFGLLSLSSETLVFEYLFATTNSLQGFFLFVFHCLCNSEVRADFARRHNWKTSSSNNGKPPWFSGTFGLNVASGLRKFRDSISFEFASSSHSENPVEHDRKDHKESPKGDLRTLPAISDEDNCTAPKDDQASIPPQEAEDSNPSEVGGDHRADDAIAPINEEPSEQPNPVFAQTPKQEVLKAPRYESQQPEKENSIVKKKQILPPLLAMPMKNDIILPVRSNRVGPMSSPRPRNKPLDEARQTNAIKSSQEHRESSPTSDDLPSIKLQEQSIPQSENVDNEREKEGYKIPMSYDSGLNSIDNESLLEEEYYDDFVEMPYGKYRVGINGFDVPT